VGNVVNFADHMARLRAGKDSESAPESEPDIGAFDEEALKTPEGKALYQMLAHQGITVLDEEALRDFNTVMAVVRGMKDRQTGNPASADCMTLECLAQALHYNKDVPTDDSFDDLLSKLD
jgi:hypothetical protein